MENPRKIGYAFGQSYDRNFDDEYKYDNHDYGESTTYYLGLLNEYDNDTDIIRYFFRRAMIVSGINDHGLDLSNKANLLSLVETGTFYEDQKKLSVFINEMNALFSAVHDLIEKNANRMIEIKDDINDLNLDQEILNTIYTKELEKLDSETNKYKSVRDKLENEYRRLMKV